MKQNKKHNIAFMVDGSFLPIRNGTYYSIFHLMNALYKTGKVNPNLVIGYRGWDNPKLYYRQLFRTLFLPARYYYNDTGALEYAFNFHNIEQVHIYNAEEVLNMGVRLQRIEVKIVYEAVNIDHVLYSRLKKDKKQANQLRSLQKSAMNIADYVLCRSDIDYNHIMDMGINKNKVSIYRGAINVGSIKYQKRRKQRYQIVFLGHMYYPPNENSLKLIIKKILPKLKKINSQYKISVVGITPPKIIEKYSDSGIVFRGGIDDLSTELLKYDIAIAPLFEGSGTRLKLLDFLASGMPTITTSLGIEGLNGSITDSLIIEDDINNYASKIDELMNNLSKYDKMSISGRRFVQKHYDWNNCLKPFLNLYKKYDKKVKGRLNS